ncbi:hypothetical protein C943_01128 [Mariniradius saccharolyticus AK6]|uniref:DUF2911 domain-containing protein n=2 Tax=Mariniradius TaxID=1245590 RepID=M7Y577_9BACT|nr:MULTISPECIES: DUF2911 domain-containing protein [Mariniradius]EMS32401.1 hypothetical protein C943_01128 [Mariniradius saccharolyticus AK6]MCF1752583.1 DUF2911 domain-containing protein [Mariniradius sediminis]
MKKNILLLAFLAAGTLLISSCGGEKSSESTSAESTEAGAEEAKPEAEQRPSPLRSLQGTIGAATVAIQYGAPSVKGRVIWGDLVPYNEVWRTGANEATYVDLSADVTVEGQPLKAGRYSLFTIPKSSGKWTVIFNSEWDLEHGHFQYKQENDVLRVESTPEWVNDSQEQLTIAIESPGIVVRWEKLKLPIAIQ